MIPLRLAHDSFSDADIFACTIERGIVVFPYIYKHNSLLVNDLTGA